MRRLFFSDAGLVVRSLYGWPGTKESVQKLLHGNPLLRLSQWAQELSTNRGDGDVKQTLAPASALRYDLPVAAMSPAMRALQIGIALSPRWRGCAYPQDANTRGHHTPGDADAGFRPCLAADANAEAIAEYVAKQVARINCPGVNGWNLHSEGQCCSLHWNATFAAQRLMAQRAPIGCNAGRTHNEVGVGYTLADVHAIFYPSYDGESADLEHTACTNAKRMHAALAAFIRAGSDAAAPTIPEFARLKLPFKRPKAVGDGKWWDDILMGHDETYGGRRGHSAFPFAPPRC